MTVKAPDGRSIVQTQAYIAVLAATTALIAAPGVGLRIRVLEWAGVLGGAALNLQESGTGTIRASQSAGTLGRPFVQTNFHAVAIFADNQGVSIQNTGATTEEGTITFVVEPTS